MSLWEGVWIVNETVSWIVVAIIAAVFISLRHLYVKKFCLSSPPEILVFSTRLVGSVFLLPGLFRSEFRVSHPPAFLAAIFVTVSVTAIATTVQMHVIQRSALSRNVPYLALIPVFMIPWGLILLGQSPSAASFLGLMIASAGAYVLNASPDQPLFAPIITVIRKGPARLMFLVALALGLTTTCDRIAIGASSAYTYLVVWTVASTVIMGSRAFRHGRTLVRRTLFSKHTIAQAGLWTVGFSSQMVAVELSSHIPMGVAYVKMLTMLSILITVTVGGRLFSERHVLRSSLAAGMMLLGAVVTILGRK